MQHCIDQLLKLETWEQKFHVELFLFGGDLIPGTVLCKSNANDNQGISRFVLAIDRQYVSETYRVGCRTLKR